MTLQDKAWKAAFDAAAAVGELGKDVSPKVREAAVSRAASAAMYALQMGNNNKNNKNKA